jgi:hypothetical protein
MKKEIRIIFGVIALIVLFGRIALMKNSVNKNKQEEKINNMILNQSKYTTEKEGEFYGESEGSKLLKESYEKRKEKSAQQKNDKNVSDKKVIKEIKKVENLSIEELLKQAFYPITKKNGPTLNHSLSTNEVSLIYVTKLRNGAQIVGSTYRIGSAYLDKESYYFNPLKWETDLKNRSSTEEYFISNIRYKNQNGKIKSGNLKVYWDWGANGDPYYFQEIE